VPDPSNEEFWYSEMKVKCTNLFDAKGRVADSSPWLTIGRVYHVMSIFMDQQSGLRYRIISHDRDPGFATMGYQSAKSFELISTIIPSNWKIGILEDSAIDISPEAWQQHGFLEAFYDRNPDTYSIFERERDIILSEDP
jgi:hypothetical protein